MKERIKALYVKNYKKIVRLIAIIIPMIIVFSSFTLDASAFGDFNDYDSDSDFDWDGGGDSYSGSSSSDGDFFFVIEILLYLFKIVYKVFGLPGVCCLATILVIGCVLFGVIKAKKNKDKEKYSSPKYKGYVADTYQEADFGSSTPAGPSANTANTANQGFDFNNSVLVHPELARTNTGTTTVKPDRTGEISRIVKERDVNFTDKDFIAYAGQVYADVQYASCERNYSSVQAVVHSSFFEKRNDIAGSQIAQGIVPHIDRLTVEGGYLTSYRRDKENEYIEIVITSALIDYQVNEQTGALINGDMSKRNRKEFALTFMRDKAARTPEAGSSSRAFNCPKCGGTMNNAATFGVCPYCGSSVKSGEYGWVLYDMRIALAGSVDKGIVIDE